MILKRGKKPLESTTCLCSSEWNIAEQLEHNTFVLTSVNIIIIPLLLSLKDRNKNQDKEKAHRSGLIQSVA
jgi:hypothetical protein